MEKIKKFLDCYIPTETCNLRCHYCYIAQQRRFNQKIAEFKQSKETIRKAFSKKRLGGTCLINLCAGGETLLSTEVLPVVKELLQEGHYVMIVTNGTITQRFQEAAEWPEDLKKRLFFKFSFHYLEMKRLNMMDRFFDNVNLVKNSGISFTVEVTPSDELVPYIEELKNVCMERLGTLCHVTIARDDRTNGIDVLSDHNFEDYKKIWGQFDSDLFKFKSEIFYKKRNEFCYAGDWSLYINLGTGAVTQCYCGKLLGNIYDNIEKPLYYEAVGHNCSIAHCYNGHAFLTLGDIPELKTPTYAQMRNRICEDGTEWLKPELKAFFSTKLNESNKEYGVIKEFKWGMKNSKDKKYRRIRSYNRKIASIFKSK